MILDFSLFEFTIPQAKKAWEHDIVDFIQEYTNHNQIKVQTSGSTGQPKTYFLEKSAMQQSARLTAAFLELKKGDTALLCMPVQYIAGKMMLVRAIEIGLKLYCIEPKVRLTLPASIDFAALTPMQAEGSLLELHQIRTLILGGAKVSEELENKLASLSTEVYETYGMTETITHIAMRKLNRDAYFRTLDKVKIRQDERGCLVIKTPYFQDEIMTNDMVEIVDNTSFELLGRIDNIINSGGLKINPEKIEDRLQPYISQPFIIHSVPDKVLGQKVVLVIEGNPVDVHYPEDLIPKNQQPKATYFVPSFPRTMSGKIQRKSIVLPQ